MIRHNFLVAASVLACLVACSVALYQTGKRRAQVLVADEQRAVRIQPSDSLPPRMEKLTRDSESAGESSRLLKTESNALPRLPAADIPAEEMRAEAALDLANALMHRDQFRRLMDRMEKAPGMRVPEFAFVTADDIIEASRKRLVTDMDYRRAMSQVRTAGESVLVDHMEPALERFLAENPGQFPTNVAQLAPFFDPLVKASLLSRWKVVPSKELPRFRKFGPQVITQIRADAEFDRFWVLGAEGKAWCQPNPTEPVEK